MDHHPVQVGIRALKARLSDYMRKVKKGQIIVITDRGEPIGRIVPAYPHERSLENLQKAGCVSWSGKRLRSRKPGARVKGDRTVSDLLIENRG